MPAVYVKEARTCFVQAAVNQVLHWQLRPRRSLAKQTQLSTLWSLNLSMRRKGKCKNWAGSGKPAGGNKDGNALLSNVPKDTWRVIQPGTDLKAWISLRPRLHVKEFSRRKDLPIEQGETDPVMATLLHSRGNNRDHWMLDAQPENVSNKVVRVTTPNEPLCLPNETLVVGEVGELGSV